MKNGTEFQEAVRKINCLELEDFKDIFGHNIGAYIWDKFAQIDFNIFDLICYLDPINMQLLYQYLTKGE